MVKEPKADAVTLEDIMGGIEEIKQALEIFYDEYQVDKEEILEKIENLGLPGSGFGEEE